MTNILAIDPGVHQYGWASWHDLTHIPFRCGFSRIDEGYAYCQNLFDEIIVEKPQWRGPRTPRPQDLIDLALAAGILGGPRATYVPVSQWKGSKGKENMHRRLLGDGVYENLFPKMEKRRDDYTTPVILSATEVIVIESLDVPKTKLHNVLDAVCLLMWRLGRMKR